MAGKRNKNKKHPNKKPDIEKATEVPCVKETVKEAETTEKEAKADNNSKPQNSRRGRGGGRVPGAPSARNENRDHGPKESSESKGSDNQKQESAATTNTSSQLKKQTVKQAVPTRKISSSSEVAIPRSRPTSESTVKTFETAHAPRSRPASESNTLKRDDTQHLSSADSKDSIPTADSRIDTKENFRRPVNYHVTDSPSYTYQPHREYRPHQKDRFHPRENRGGQGGNHELHGPKDIVNRDRPQRGKPTQSDMDMNWRGSNPKTISPPRMDVPTKSVKELLEPEILPEISLLPGGDAPIISFTGEASVPELVNERSSVEVEVGEAVIEDDKELDIKNCLGLLTLLLGPVSKKFFSLDNILDHLDIIVKSMPHEKTTAILDENADTVVKTALLWLNRYFFLKCCGAGYIAKEFLDSDMPPFDEFEEVDKTVELDKVFAFLDRLASTTIINALQKEEIQKSVTKVRELLPLLESDDVVELEKRNIAYALSDPVVRLQFGKPVTDDEFYKIVNTSVTENCGNYLWIVDHCPERMLGSARIVESIITGISMKRFSKDQRPSRAFYKVVPSILDSLNDNDLNALAEKFVDNSEMKVPNWPEMLFQGYLMSLENIRSKPKDQYDVVFIKLQESESVEEFKPFLLACALIAEFGAGKVPPVYDHSTDPFCTRLARVFVNSSLSPEKRSLLLETLMALPAPIKSRLLAEGRFPEETSLYFTVRAIITETHKLSNQDVRKWGALAIRELSKVLSPARMIAYSVMDCLNDSRFRIKAAGLLSELTSLETLIDELQEGKHLSPAELVNMALAQYEEPQGGGPQARYAFIEKLLQLVDKVLEKEVTKELVNSVDDAFKGKNLTWYQHFAIIGILFKNSGDKLTLPQPPSLENTLESMKNFNATGILQAWPNADETRKSFEKAVTMFMSSNDIVMEAYVFLSAAQGDDSKIKEHKSFLYEFVERLPSLTNTKKEETSDDTIENSKIVDDNEDSSIVKDEEEHVKPLVDPEDHPKETTWLSDELLKECTGPDLRRAVLRIAVNSPYSQEAMQVQFTTSQKEKTTTPQPSPLKVSPVDSVKQETVDHGESEKSRDSTGEEAPTGAPISEPLRNEFLSPEDIKEIEDTENIPLIDSIDVKGERFPDYLPPFIPPPSSPSMMRCVVWINESNVDRIYGDIIGALRGPGLKDQNIHRVNFIVSGRRPKTPMNEGRRLLPNAHLPLHIDVQAYSYAFETVERMKIAVDIVKRFLRKVWETSESFRQSNHHSDKRDASRRSEQHLREFHRQSFTHEYEFTLDKVPFDVYSQKMDDPPFFGELQRTLKCKLTTTNRKKKVGPPRVQVKCENQKAAAYAEDYIRKLFA